MKVIHTYYAAPTGGKVTEPGVIIMDVSADAFKFESLGEQDKDYDAEADRIFHALYDTLPGGVFDRLLGKMLDAKASHFRVAHQ